MPPSSIRRIAICTGGGDAPGLNAVIRSVVIAAINRDLDAMAFATGSTDLFPERYLEGGVFRLTGQGSRYREHGRDHAGVHQQRQSAALSDTHARRVHHRNSPLW